MSRRPSPPRTRSLSPAGILMLASFLSSAPRSEGAQITPRILHDGLGCIVAGQHAVIDALVEPTDDLVTVKVYFRAEIYPAFFYVEMTRAGDRFQAVLPRPTRDIDSVVYYLEAVDSAFNSLRTEEFRPRVVLDPADCDEDSPQPMYIEDPAGITVGATAEGATFPPGFLTEGIVGTITAAGRAAGTSTGTWVAVGAAAGAAAGVGVLIGGGGDAQTTTVPAGGITTTAAVTSTIPVTTTVSAGSEVDACFDTDPNPPTIPVGGTVRFDATCSNPRDQIAKYEWDFHDGREGREGRVITRVYNSPGVFGAELTITDSRGNQDSVQKDVRVQQAPGPGPGPGPGPTSSTTTVPGNADLAVTSLTFSPPTPVNTTEAYTIGYRNNGPDLDPTVTLVVAFNAAGAGGAPIGVSTPGCGTSSGAGSLTVSCSIGALASGAAGSKTISVRFPSTDTYSVTATIFGGASDLTSSNDSRTVSTPVSLKAGSSLDTAFVSEIQSASAPGQVHATIEMNGFETAVTDDAGARRHVMKTRPGTNLLVGHASGASLEGALWKLDFTASEGFVSGSILVETGDVLSLNARSVVLRLSGRETRFRLRFQSEP